MDQRRERRVREKSPTITRTVFLCLLLLGFILFLVTGSASADFLISYGRVHPGVSISGLDVGSMTPAQARQKLYGESSAILDRPFLILHGARSWKISPRGLNVTLDIERAVDAAYSVGRKGNLFRQVRERYLLWRQPREVSLPVSFNQKKLDDFVEKVRAEVGIKPREARIVIRNGEASVLTSREGLEIRKGALRRLLVESVTAPKRRRIMLPTSSVPVRISTEEAETALRPTRKMLAAPLTLRFGPSRWVLAPAEIGGLLAFKEEKERSAGSRFFSHLRPILDPESTSALLKSLTTDISSSAQDATFEVTEDRVTVVPSKDGFEVNGQASLPLLEEALLCSTPRQASIIMSKTKPRRTTEIAYSMGIKERVSTFTTHFDPRAVSRVHNIRLLADALDGTIIASDDVFSFNETVGPRTAAKGYQEAPTIVNGELVPTLGGGICQVGTTFFNAIFFAGLEIVERHNHSFYISKYPAGRDATLSYGGADLKFRNDTPNYLLLKTASTPNSLTVSLYGTNPHREVTFTTAPFTDFLPFESKLVPDPALPKDQQKIEENGVTGRKTMVVRTVKEEGRIIHKDKLVSHYKPKKAIVKLGTGEPVPVTAGEQIIPPQEAPSQPGSPPPNAGQPGAQGNAAEQSAGNGGQ